VDRLYYKEVGSKNHFEAFNFLLAIDTVSKRLEALNGIDREFLALESIFPKRILNSSDNDYQNYVILRKVLEDEIRFQKDYLIALKFFNREYQCRGNTAEFVRAVDDFLAFFKEKDHLAGNVVQEAQSVLRSRLNEVAPFYDQRLSGKEDAKPFEPELYLIEPFLRLPSLYEASGLPLPAETQSLFQFVRDFDSKAKTLAALKDSLENIRKAVKACPDMPQNGFFGGIQARLSEMEKNIPVQLGNTYGKYSSFKCSQAMNNEIIQFGAGVVKLANDCRAAEDLVVSLNAMKAQRDYPGMLALLLKNANLAFLLEKYKPLDKLSVDEQGNKIRGALSSQAWGGAEAGLFKLHQDKNFLNPAAIKAHKEKTVENLEDSLYAKIDLATRSRVGKFLEEKVHTLQNVDSLYTDSVFLPVYDVKFYSGTKGELLKRKTDLIDHLAKMKENEFPARAVKLLFDEFTRNPHDSGVYKAKAIVAHGTHYKGEDKEIQTRLSECDPLTPKWIVKPKEYRRLFGLPVTDKETGRNKYLVRINVDIPTDAQFPVYDVNIKLPKDLSGNAAEKQWYDQITLNKKLLKNEGRFTISAPTSANDYECQITPVQMSKDKRNILEIAFSWPAYRVFVLSVMVQKPIIKKN